MKVVMTYPRHADWADDWYQSVAAVAPAGMKIVALPAGPRETLITFPDLDRKWKNRDAERMGYYEAIQRECEDADVLFTYGAGIHPEFLKYLPTFNCYFFCDDPEDSPWQSAKVATAFDAACYANIASGFQYESLGCRCHSWLPIFTSPTDIPGPAGRDVVLNGIRSESVVFVGGLDDYSSYRGRRLERFAKAFPKGVFMGRGWPAGGVDDDELTPLYLRSRIGFNCHRTTGPINRRMFQLPAHGVMQICDNKTGLGQIFALGREVAGYGTIDEAIELTRHYLEHDKEREAVARAGYERFWKDYHAGANWTRLRDKLLEWGVRPGERKHGTKQELPKKNTTYFIGKLGEKMSQEAGRWVRSAKAAKREYLRKDPWWKIYDRVFTSEAVYIPDYGDAPPPSAEVSLAQNAKSTVPPENVLRAQQGAIRWAMTQLIGDARRIGISDQHADILESYAKVDPARTVETISSPARGAADSFDLLLCVAACSDAMDLQQPLRQWASLAPRAVFGFAGGNLPWQDAGEIYWALKSAYDEVSVFCLPNPVVPWLEPASQSAALPLVAMAKKTASA
jgi:hypothetical protein